MYSFLAFLALIQAVGVIVLIRAVRSAPMGCEDESGFYLTHPIGATLKPCRVSKVRCADRP